MGQTTAQRRVTNKAEAISGNELVPVAQGAVLTSGVLVIGNTYEITAFEAGDDFTNCGASANVTGEQFVATDTAPLEWSGESELTDLSAMIDRVATVNELVAPLQIIGPRVGGWDAPSGSPVRGAYTEHGSLTISDPPIQSEVQNLNNAIVGLSQTMVALITDLRARGIIGT